MQRVWQELDYRIICRVTKGGHIEHCKVGQKLGVSLPLLTCSPSAWPFRLLYRRGRKSRRDLWITLYNFWLLNVVAHKLITDIWRFHLSNLIGLGTNKPLLHPRPVGQLFIGCMFGNLTDYTCPLAITCSAPENMFVVFLAPFCASVCQRQVASILNCCVYTS